MCSSKLSADNDNLSSEGENTCKNCGGCCDKRNISRRKFTKLVGLGSAAMTISPGLLSMLAGRSSANDADRLSDAAILFRDGFKTLPKSARPWVYWMWLKGNITKEGITADLEAMNRIGIGGSIMMNLGSAGGKRVPDGAVRFMTPEWEAMVEHAITESARLGMEFDLNDCEGWTSGGPWITPELGMQKLTWSETPVSGSRKFSGRLPLPPVNLKTYKQVSVLAVPVSKLPPLPEAGKTVNKRPRCSLQLDYGKPVTVRSLTVVRKNNNVLLRHCELWVSDDGSYFKKVKAFETGWFNPGAPGNISVGVGTIKGRFFRLLMPDETDIPEDVDFSMDTKDCLDHWRIKAAHVTQGEHGNSSPLFSFPEADEAPASNRRYPESDQIVDLSDKMKDDGSLNWEAPPGDWVVLRIGYTPNGVMNKVSSPQGRGLYPDRLNRKATEVQLSGMVDKVVQKTTLHADKGLTMIHSDSFEASAWNWTASFPQEFKKRRGYDLTPWLPVMAGGRVVGSMEKSNRFLWDIRRTLADLMVDNSLKYFRELCHQRGLKFSSESAGRGQFLYDPVFFQATSDLPMGECWNKPQELRPRPDCKAAASAIHLMGLPFAGAEIFTQNRHEGGQWLETLFSLKSKGDLAFCFGINRYFFHRCILQPDPGKRPGLTWPGVGINFDTTQTWWNAAGSYIDYLTRCQYLLQQGKFVADVAVLTGEGAPASLVRPMKNPVNPDGKQDPSTITEGTLRYFGEMPFLPPRGYDYDYLDVNFIQSLQVQDGRLVLPNGMSYAVLVLPPAKRMTLPLARKIRSLVHAGAVVVGMKPEATFSLTDYPAADEEIQAVSRELWGGSDDETPGSNHRSGKGNVYYGNGTGQALKDLKLKPDFTCERIRDSTNDTPDIEFIHRRTGEADIYFLSNQADRTVEVNGIFRISGSRPELWLPDTGEVIPCKTFQQRDGRTSIPLKFDPIGSLFVIFPKQSSRPSAGTAESNIPVLQKAGDIEGPWQVYFDPKWGGPGAVQTDELASWTKNQDRRIRFYSGTATYKKRIHIPENLLTGGRPLYLDLGTVKEMAVVRLNGREAGALWKPPFRIEISKIARSGTNQLEVDVINLWPNRLIGDAGLPKEKQVTKVNWHPYTSQSPLLDSGLLGPVILLNPA